MKTNYRSINFRGIAGLLLIGFFAASCLCFEAKAYSTDLPIQDSSIEGRWDITIDASGTSLPSWLEVRHSGPHTLVGDFVGISGSSRPISKINFQNGIVSFSIPPQWETGDSDLSFEGSLQNNNLTGSISYPDGKKYSYTAVRAPSLQPRMTPVWGKPVRIFNGKDLKGWRDRKSTRLNSSHSQISYAV